MAQEKKLEQKFKEWVEKQGGVCIKLESPSRNGVSDRLVVLPYWGMIVVELKADHGRMSAEQKKWLVDVHVAGGDAMLMRGPEGFEEFKRAYESYKRLSEPPDILH